MARMSIYVPDELKGRMDAVDTVNWSAIAQTSFERELRLHAKLTEDEMNVVIERLKSSKIAQIDDVIEIGVFAGKNWAKETASYLDLKQAAYEITRVMSLMAGVRATNVDTGEKEGHFFVFPKNVDRPDAIDSDHYGDKYFEHGFCVGLVEVWEQVKDHLS